MTAYPFLLSSEFLGCTHSLLLESALEKNGGNKDGILQPNLYPYTINNASMLFFFLILSTFFWYWWEWEKLKNRISITTFFPSKCRSAFQPIETCWPCYVQLINLKIPPCLNEFGLSLRTSAYLKRKKICVNVWIWWSMSHPCFNCGSRMRHMVLESAAMHSSNITQSQAFLASLALTKKRPEQFDASVQEESGGIRAVFIAFFEIKLS